MQDFNPYQLSKDEKSSLFLKELSTLTELHLQRCPEYARIFDRLALKKPPYKSLEEVPYLPAALFKSYDLMSIPRDQIFKRLHSSGTTSSSPSRIYLDRETAQNMTNALAVIGANILGKERMPMLIVDTEDVLRDPNLFSARGAAIVGMLMFGRDPFYILDHDQAEFEAWQQRHAHEPWFIFGFTFMIWKTALPISPKGSTLLHGGGWKKLEAAGVSQDEFKAHLKKMAGITRCYNFYGMVEQTGSIAMECEEGFLHTSDFSEVIIRDPETLREAAPGNVGVIQTLSRLPRSYPGHSILTEDLGFEWAIDDCPCGRKGKTFRVVGRVPQAEPRGCSDVGGN